MSSPAPSTTPRSLFSQLPFYYGWVMILMSALAMAATFPGRSHGLGTITERIVDDPVFLNDSSLFTELTHLTGPTQIAEAKKILAEKNSDAEQWSEELTTFRKRKRERFGDLNLWATLLGALFCLPCGQLLDRFGSRKMLTAVLAALGVVVIAMTQASSYWMFFVALLFSRGLGQSALSVYSLALPGKWFSKKLGAAMGVYTVLMAIAFISAFQIVGMFHQREWQTVWGGIGWILLLGATPLSWLLVRNSPEESGLAVDGDAAIPATTDAAPLTGFSLRNALCEPAFWAFALATSMYGLVSSGISLFNQDILRERGFAVEDFYRLAKFTTGLGLAGNFLGGFLVQWISLRAVMGISMSLLAAALFWMPFVSTWPQLTIYAVGFSIGGGMMTVVFFTAFGKVFGRRHLGQIQGIAQMLTVLASAVSQKLVPFCNQRYDSYSPFFQASACIVAALGLWTCFLKMPASGAAAHAE